MFKRGDYFEKTFKNLKKIIFNNKWESRDEERLRYINQVLIVEFLIKGYSLNSIASFPDNIFSKYDIQKLDYIRIPRRIEVLKPTGLFRIILIFNLPHFSIRALHVFINNIKTPMGSSIY